MLSALLSIQYRVHYRLLCTVSVQNSTVWYGTISEMYVHSPFVRCSYVVHGEFMKYESGICSELVIIVIERKDKISVILNAAFIPFRSGDLNEVALGACHATCWRVRRAVVQVAAPG